MGKLGVLGLMLILAAVFICGWLAKDVYSFLQSFDREQPFSVDSREKNSPSDWLKQEQIVVKEDEIVIKIENATWAKFADTNSMDPIIDETSHAIKLVPSDPSELNPGDIISFKTDVGTVIHRIIEKGEDFGYVSHCPAIPGCHSQGSTIEEAIDNIKDAIKSCLEVIDIDFQSEKKVNDQIFMDIAI